MKGRRELWLRLMLVVSVAVAGPLLVSGCERIDEWGEEEQSDTDSPVPSDQNQQEETQDEDQAEGEQEQEQEEEEEQEQEQEEAEEEGPDQNVSAPVYPNISGEWEVTLEKGHGLLSRFFRTVTWHLTQTGGDIGGDWKFLSGHTWYVGKLTGTVKTTGKLDIKDKLGKIKLEGTVGIGTGMKGTWEADSAEFDASAGDWSAKRPASGTRAASMRP
ncbi:MAG: hypothetical protein HQ559_14155 [Lentisphaerae bacterium]|nr:hypothetical protein [Lentisphaerota bacterium]